MAANKLRVEGRTIVDVERRQVVLHGPNYSGRHKVPPFVFAKRPEELDQLASLGFNAIRLVMTWEAIEPERDRFDDTFLTRVSDVAKWAVERGIHVIVDMHQDIYSRWFGGSGAPGWSIPESIRPSEPWGEDRFWFMRYGNSDEVRSCLSRFWNNEDDLQDHWIGSLVQVARRLAEVPGVVGFQPYNEPFPGDADLEDWESRVLLAFYERLTAAVREVAPDWIAFLEGMLMSSESGTSLPVDRIENAVYFPHFYDKIALLQREYGGDAEMTKTMRIYEADAARMNVPWMLGEYGISHEAKNARQYMIDQQRRLSEYSSGGTVWHYNPTGEGWNQEGLSIVGRGGEERPLIDVLCRPYPMATAGRLKAHDYDDDARVFTMTWDAAEGETIVFLPARHFPSPTIELSSGRTSVDDDRLKIVDASGRTNLTVR